MYNTEIETKKQSLEKEGVCMALAICPGCGREIQTHNRYCPWCGQEISKYFKEEMVPEEGSSASEIDGMTKVYRDSLQENDFDATRIYGQTPQKEDLEKIKNDFTETFEYNSSYSQPYTAPEAYTSQPSEMYEEQEEVYEEQEAEVDEDPESEDAGLFGGRAPWKIETGEDDYQTGESAAPQRGLVLPKFRRKKRRRTIDVPRVPAPRVSSQRRQEPRRQEPRRQEPRPVRRERAPRRRYHDGCGCGGCGMGCLGTILLWAILIGGVVMAYKADLGGIKTKVHQVMEGTSVEQLQNRIENKVNSVLESKVNDAVDNAVGDVLDQVDQQIPEELQDPLNDDALEENQ